MPRRGARKGMIGEKRRNQCFEIMCTEILFLSPFHRGHWLED